MKMILNVKTLLTILIMNVTLNAQGGWKLTNDNVQVSEDESVVIDVLKNDDIKDKSNLFLEIVGSPELGTAEISGNQVVYTPFPNANGIDVFKYKADIGTDNGTAQIRVNINQVNDAPDAVVLLSLIHI